MAYPLNPSDTNPALGQTTKSASLPVTLASDDLLAPGATSSIAATADAATNATLLSANSSRKGFIVYNDSDQVCYVKYGATATSTDFSVLLLPYATLFEDNWTGRVDAIWAANSSGNARVTELT